MSTLAALESFGLEWTRPWGLSALVLPLVVLLASFRPERPRSHAVGTLHLWRLAASREPVTGERRRRRIPLERLFLLLALTAGALALGSPRALDEEGAHRWRVVLGSGPALFLDATDQAGRGIGGGSRLALAVGEARAFLDGRGAGEVLWTRSAARPGAFEELLATLPPDGWLVAPARSGSTAWDLVDGPGVLWVRPQPPAEEPVEAGVVTPGGGPVPGAIARAGPGRVVWWDGESVEEREGKRERVALDADLPAALRELVRIWAADRGLEVVARGAGATLSVESFPTAGGDLVARRGGWSLRGSGGAAALARDPGHGTWLAGEDGVPVVAWTPGLVRIALASCEPAGDPAAFAVDWAELLDGALPDPVDVTALAHRRALPPAEVIPPRSPFPPPEPGTPPPRPIPAMLALVATAFAVLGGLVSLARVK